MRKGWASANIRELFEINYGKGLPGPRRNSFGQVPVYGSNGVVGMHDRGLTFGSTIIIGRKGSVGEVHLSPAGCWPIDTTYYIDNFLHGLPPEYWMYFLRSLRLGQHDRSSTIPGVNRDDLYGIEVPIPPLAEQRRIVAKLEKLLVKVGVCRKRLDKIPSILKRFRQSVLAAACSGRLTADWREKNPNVEPASELLARISLERDELMKKGRAKSKARGQSLVALQGEELPHHWFWTRIGDVAQCLDHRRVPVNKDERATRTGSVPYYGANGQVGWIDDYLFDEELILLVEDETFVGREKPFSYVVRGKSWVNNHAHVMKPLGGIACDYLNICWAYYDFTPLTSGTTGRRKLTQSALLDADFRIAPLHEQHEIVRRVEGLLRAASNIEKRCATATLHIGNLTQSILSKAFRGELVLQDPNDEPAALLLDRIKKSAKEQQPIATSHLTEPGKQQRSRHTR